MKTFHLTQEQATHKWRVLDADGKILGRLAVEIARYLMGKYKPDYSPHVDSGDYVVITNSAKIKVTGAKFTDKIYYHHSGQPRGFKAVAFKDMQQKDPNKIIYHAVKGMLPKNKLAAVRLQRLKLFVDNNHPYQDKIEG
jgi:large subunit ribosomal protein L13